MRIPMVFFCTAATAVFNASPADTVYGLPAKDVAIVYAEPAHLYAEPSVNSELLCSPPVGTPVLDLAPAGSSILQGGILSPWMGGVCEVDGKSHRGFILMADLALTELKLGGDTLFVFGLDSLRTVGSGYCGQAKVVFEGNVLQRIQLTPPNGFWEEGEYLYWVSSRRIDPAGFSGMDALFVLSFEYQACGFLNRAILFAWSDRSLVMGPSADSVAEAGLFHTVEEFLFPPDDGSDPNILRISLVVEEFVEEARAYTVTRSDTTRFEWTGTAFREL